MFSNSTGRSRIPLARKKSATLSSVVEPGWRQTLAPSSPRAEAAPRERRTISALPSW
jgi:hypothetical protein